MESQPNIPLPERPAHLPERLTVGMKVVRGPSWMWSDQDTLDGGSGVGVVVDATPKSDLDVWVTVRWLDEGANYTYRYGRQPRLAQGCFWVDIIPAPQVHQVPKCTCVNLWAPCTCGAFRAEMLAKGYTYNKWAPKGFRWEKPRD